jgi:hypothetical protein
MSSGTCISQPLSKGDGEERLRSELQRTKEVLAGLETQNCSVAFSFKIQDHKKDVPIV